MDTPADKVLIIGGGVAGLSAACELALLNVGVDLVEKTDFLGGHGIQFACKATEKCVGCGACVVEEKLKNAVENSQINILLGTTVKDLTKADRFSVTLHRRPEYIDPRKCTGCRTCFDRCPADGALIRGFSQNNIPLYAIRKEKCLYFLDKSCSECENLCPEGAINLNARATEYIAEADAVILATGFKPFDPENKPYGYKLFKNVITNLDLERMLRQQSRVHRPSDSQVPKSIAFVQCVGSRDSSLNHLWCSKVCCGSALRMARLIKARHPETRMTIFYIDVQTFGENFQSFYEGVQRDVRMVRAIPGEIFKAEKDNLQVNYYEARTGTPHQENFDMVVLSIGMNPSGDTKYLAELLNMELAGSGYVGVADGNGSAADNGIFATGTVLGPMSIDETVAHGGFTAWKTLKYLERNHQR
ncbi:MAG: CoB--CoM heterodisulfide reductase iron-sulfur subunit A family protein [Deltaproteobacteria bacterium]|nr:CoB--CoM heterodisulfide reductase iron-sulfur subunit A family protein [Deltaproteobacteria bacterium]